VRPRDNVCRSGDTDADLVKKTNVCHCVRSKSESKLPYRTATNRKVERVTVGEQNDRNV
jgi:hypothetical protein